MVMLEAVGRLVAKGMTVELSLDEGGRGVCVLFRQSADESPDGLTTHAAYYGPTVESALKHALEQIRSRRVD